METHIGDKDIEEVNLDKKQQLLDRLKSKQDYETLLLDMFRIGDLKEWEYNKLNSESQAAYAQFKKDLETHKNTN